MSQASQPKPRKKSKFQDRTTREEKARANRLRDEAKAGMAKWLTQEPRVPEELTPLPDTPPSSPLPSPVIIDLSVDSPDPVTRPVPNMNSSDFLSSNVPERKKQRKSSGSSSESDTESDDAEIATWLKQLTDMDMRARLQTSYSTAELESLHARRHELETKIVRRRAVLFKKKPNQPVMTKPDAFPDEEATSDVFSNQLDDLVLNERDTPTVGLADLSSSDTSMGSSEPYLSTEEKIDDGISDVLDVAALRTPWLKLSGQEIKAGVAGEQVIERRRRRIQKKRKGPAKRRIDKLARPNFSLQKLSQNRYILHAVHVTKGVVAQVRSLLLKIPGMSLTVSGRMIAKKNALREIVRELIQKSRVEVVL
jgi:hypothetical protein